MSDSEDYDYYDNNSEYSYVYDEDHSTDQEEFEECSDEHDTHSISEGSTSLSDHDVEQSSDSGSESELSYSSGTSDDEQLEQCKMKKNTKTELVSVLAKFDKITMSQNKNGTVNKIQYMSGQSSTYSCTNQSSSALKKM